MGRYVIRRLLQAIPLLFIISVIGFTLNHLVPGNPFQAELALNPNATQEDIQRLVQKYGLDRPIHEQYLTWMGNVLRGDFGRSLLTRQPVLTMILERLPNTLLLTGSAFLISLAVGVPLGIYCALHRNSAVDNALRAVAAFVTAFPAWWIGLIAIVVLGGMLGLFPQGGLYSVGVPGAESDVIDRLWHLALPATVAGLDGSIGYLRIMRSQTLDTMRQDFVRTAYAKGLSQRLVMWGHVLRNAFLPVWTGFGGLLAGLLGGSALLEKTFSWPGIGRLVLDSAFKRDFPVILASLMISATLILIGYIIVDIGYAWIDPRVRHE
ncbi:MAG TPA: ABC transporter permease [Chloroflexota bacterium]|jgi:peptide/nickel transport system permease protein|nr:ABC transporter permease [Chloroflexota bacterium]